MVCLCSILRDKWSNWLTDSPYLWLVFSRCPTVTRANHLMAADCSATIVGALAILEGSAWLQIWTKESSTTVSSCEACKSLTMIFLTNMTDAQCVCHVDMFRFAP